MAYRLRGSPQVDLAIVTVIPPELAAARVALELPENSRSKDETGTIFYHGKVRSALARRDYEVVLTCIGRAGNALSAAAVQDVIARYRPQVVLLVGIAAGIRDNVRIGEVVFSERVVAYEPAAMVRTAEGSSRLEPRPEIRTVPHRMHQDVMHYQPDEARLQACFERQGGSFPRPPAGSETLYQANVATRLMTKVAAVASGEKLLRDPGKLSEIRSLQGKIEAVEMEAAGFTEACERSGVSWLVLRGISDFGDELKDDRFHEFASRTVATVMADFIKHGLGLPTSRRWGLLAGVGAVLLVALFASVLFLPWAHKWSGEQPQQEVSTTTPPALASHAPEQTSAPADKALQASEPHQEKEVQDQEAVAHNSSKRATKVSFQLVPSTPETLLLSGTLPPDEATLLESIAQTLRAQGGPTEALKYFRQKLEVDEQKLGQAHPLLAMDLLIIGNLLRETGDHAEALKCFHRALSIDEKAFGKEHPRIAIHLNNIGIVLYEQARYDEALGFFKRALSITEQPLDHKYLVKAVFLNNMSAVLFIQESYTEAYALLWQARKSLKSEAGHPGVGGSTKESWLMIVISSNTVTIDQSSPRPALISVPIPDKSVAMQINTLSGAVEVRFADGAWRELKPGMTLHASASLRTKDGASATITSDKVTVTMDPGTEVALQHLSDLLSRLLLGSGMAMVSVRPGARHLIEVKAGGSAAVARTREGTFTMSNDGAGTVAVGTREGEMTFEGNGKVIIIRAGQQSVLRPGSGGPSKPMKIPSNLLRKVQWPDKKQNKREVIVQGEAELGTRLEISGQTFSPNQDGTFKHTVRLKEGENEVTVRAVSVGGSTDEAQQKFLVDTEPPSILIKLPWDNPRGQSPRSPTP